MTVNLIEAAVAHLKAVAVARSEQKANEVVARFMAELAAADWNVTAVAPYPSSDIGKAEYHQQLGRYKLVSSLTKYDQSRQTIYSGRRGAECFVVRNDEGVARFIKNAKEDAAAQYDMFVMKLTTKVTESIGTVASATLEGSHVWGYSVLTVTGTDGRVELWKTQQILNVSVLGKLFNQWPSRKVKKA